MKRVEKGLVRMLNIKGIVPLYEQLMKKLQESIISGTYQPGEKLLSEIEMAKYYNVSVITVRKAIKELENKGLVEKKQGKGTFVAIPKYRKDMNQIISFTESCRIMGVKSGAQLIEQKVLIPSDDILKKLDLPLGSQTVFISRLRFVNDEPMAIETNYFPLEYAFLLNEPLNDCSLFQILKDKINLNISKSKKVIEICRATTKEAKLLNIRKNNPLLLIRSTAFSDDGNPVFVGSQLINGERFKFHA
ncbi:MAG: GntR family transcriptional regulator [Clostridium beijerinckii]